MKIIVLGAYGYTGKLICKELIKENYVFAIGGRKQEALLQLMTDLKFDSTVEILELTDRTSIIEIISKYDIFINCIGPFTETANILLDEISQTNKFYIDITGEINFVDHSRINYHERAILNKSTILHSCAFESVLVNLLSHQLINKRDSVRSIFSYYNTGRSKASPGTKLTMKLAKYRYNFHYLNGSKKMVDEIPIRQYNLRDDKALSALGFSLPEICFAKWDTSATNIGSYLILDQYDASYASRKPALALSPNSKDAIIEKFNTRRPKGPSPEMRQKQTYTIEVRIENNEGDWQTITLSGTDYYSLSARILVYMTKHFIEKKIAIFGVISPIEFLGKEHTLFNDLNLQPHEI